MAKGRPSIDEEAALYARWERGTFQTLEESVDYHHLKHGRGMDRWTYLRRAAGFNRTGAIKVMNRDSITYSHRNGEFLIEKDGKILSYGPPKS